MINGSPKSNGNTSIALREMEKVFKENGVDVETVTVGNKAIRGCIALGKEQFGLPEKEERVATHFIR